MQREPAAHDARQAPAQVPESQARGGCLARRRMVRRPGAGVEVASQGRTRAEAIANLREALELHFEAPVATPPSA